jgi:hypothetical protein
MYTAQSIEATGVKENFQKSEIIPAAVAHVKHFTPQHNWSLLLIKASGEFHVEFLMENKNYNYILWENLGISSMNFVVNFATATEVALKL